MARYSKRDQDEARTRLLELFPPGSTAYTVLRNVSRSGMTRSISVISKDKDGGLSDVSYLVARLTGDRIDQSRGGVIVGGCGMDMGFSLVYNMAWKLYPEGYGCIGEGCPANDHVNGDRDYTPGHAQHRDGGYAVRQRWI